MNRLAFILCAALAAAPALAQKTNDQVTEEGRQKNTQYALASFPEENHNPFSDHNDFINVNSAKTMQRIATCINRGKLCR